MTASHLFDFVFVVNTGADYFFILFGIASDCSARAVAVSEFLLVMQQPLNQEINEFFMWVQLETL